MRAAEAVDHRAVGVVAHQRGADQVPAGVAHQPLLLDLVGAGLQQRLLGALDLEVEAAARVVAHAVGHLRRRDARRVGQPRVERDPVLGIRQVLAEDPPARAAPEVLAHVQVVLRAPGGLARAGRQGGVDGAEGRGEAPLRAADEVAARVALVELVTDDLRADVPVPRLQLLVEESEHVRERMHHQPPSDHAAAVAEAVGMARPVGEQQQPRGPDRVGGEHDDVGLEDVLLPVQRDVLDPGGEPVAPHQHAAHARAGHELGAVRDRLSPVRVVRAGLRSLRQPHRQVPHCAQARRPWA